MIGNIDTFNISNIESLEKSSTRLYNYVRNSLE